MKHRVTLDQEQMNRLRRSASETFPWISRENTIYRVTEVVTTYVVEVRDEATFNRLMAYEN